MAADLKDIEKFALNLNAVDKAYLANKLLHSIHGKIDADIEQAWLDEVNKRKESLESESATIFTSSKVLVKARKRIQK